MGVLGGLYERLCEKLMKHMLPDAGADDENPCIQCRKEGLDKWTDPDGTVWNECEICANNTGVARDDQGGGHQDPGTV